MPVDRVEGVRAAGDRAGADQGVRDRLAAYRAALSLAEHDTTLDVAVWFHEGVLRQRLGDADAAVACFKKVIELAPDDPWAYWELAGLYAAQADARPAVMVLTALGDRCLERGRWTEANRAFARAAELAPDDADILRSLRRAAEYAGQTRQLAAIDEAIRAARARRSPGPRAPEAPGGASPATVTDGDGPWAAAAPADAVEIIAGPAAGIADPEVEIIADSAPVLADPAGDAIAAPPAPETAPAVPVDSPTPDGPATRQRWGALLGEIIVRQGWVTPDQVKEALNSQQRNGAPLGRILVNMQALTEEQLAMALAVQWNLPFTNLPEREVDGEAARLVPSYIARRHGVVPVRRAGNRLVVAIADPANVVAIDDIRLVTGLDVDLVIASPVDIARVHGMVYGGQADIEEILRGSVEAETVRDAPAEEASVEHLRAMVEDAPIVRAVNQILAQAVLAEASDIHIEPHAHEVKVRFRVDGILQDFMAPPKAAQAALISRIKILANMDIAERRLPQDGHIHLRTQNKDLDLRVSTLPTVLGEKVVLRILDQSRTRLTLPQLGFAADLLTAWESLITKPYGLILVTGPTGSGKTTTLYTSLARINTPERNIVSVEDPVEYQIPRVNQVQVNPKVGLTFASGLRTILRQDPDVILIGEIRDRETAEIAIQASMTGHLVLSTVHTNDAPSATTRLVDMGVEPFLIASSLIGVLAQRLVRVVCGRCKEAYPAPGDVVRHLGLPESGATPVQLYRGRGCDACRKTGYRGRLGVFELMTMNEGLRQLVLGGQSADRLREAAQAAGMRTLRQHGIERVLDGSTTVDEMLRVVFVND